MCELTLVREVGSLKLVLLDLKSGVEKLLSLGTSHGNMHSNLLVSLNGERSDSVSSLGLDGLLLGQILENLGGLGKLITGLTSTQIQNELLDLDLTHAVVSLALLLLTYHIFSKCNLKDNPSILLNDKKMNTTIFV